ncbi:MAG: ISNCY family transposase [Acidobacteriota bacterium]
MIDYPMADVTMAAFSLFFMQSESFLGYQKRLERGQNDSNCRTLFGIAKIPTDNHIRTLLDRVAPDSLRPCFDQALEMLAEQDGLRDFQRLGDRLLVALDGTEYFLSQKISCPRCLKRERSGGKTEYYHALLGATLLAPGHNRVLPLMLEFIAAQDGQVKQDCERNAAKRWLKDHGPRLARLRPIYLGDALFACQPLAEAVLATGADFLFVSKPESHKTLYEYLRGAEFQQHTVAERRPGGHSQTYGYRWTQAVPLRDGKDALAVQWLEATIANSAGKTTYRNAFVTSLGITADNVAELAACARARWKIENESFNVLKNNGYNLAHNFGHGKQHLAATFAALNLLAFAFHTVLDCLETLWQQARQAIGTRKALFADPPPHHRLLLVSKLVGAISCHGFRQSSPHLELLARLREALDQGDGGWG